MSTDEEHLKCKYSDNCRVFRRLKGNQVIGYLEKTEIKRIRSIRENKVNSLTLDFFAERGKLHGERIIEGKTSVERRRGRPKTSLDDKYIKVDGCKGRSLIIYAMLSDVNPHYL